MEDLLGYVMDKHEKDLTDKAAALGQVMNANVKDNTFKAAIAALGGAVRRARATARLQLTAELMDTLKVTPTQHVAKTLMLTVFKEAASTAGLNSRFAEPGRKADKKFVSEALEKLQAARFEGDLSAGEYEAFNVGLEARLQEIKKAEIAKAKAKVHPDLF